MKMDYKLWILIIFIIILGFLGLNLTGNLVLQDSTKDNIKIGAVLPLTGKLSFLGEDSRDGLTLAANEINNAGGINGKKVILNFQNATGGGQETINAAKQLVLGKQVDILFSSTTSISESTSTVALEYNLPLFYISTNEDIAKKDNSIYRNCFSNYKVCKDLAKFAVEKNIKSVGFLTLHRASGNDCLEGFKDGANNKIKIYNEYYSSDERSFSSMVTKLKDKEVEGIFINDYISKVPNIITKVNVLYKPEYYFLLLGADDSGNTKETRQIFSEIKTYSYMPILEDDTNNFKYDFSEKFYNKFSRAPTQEAAYAYENLYILKNSIENCKGLEKDCLYNYIVNNEHEIVLDKFSFNKYGSSVKDTKVISFDKNKWSYVN